MMTLWLALLALPEIPADPCVWRDPPAHVRAGVKLNEYGRALEYQQPYDALWGECHKDDPAQPVLIIEYSSPGLKPIRVEKVMKLSGKVWPKSTRTVSERLPLCPKPLGRRTEGAVLRGPAGQARWHNPVRISIRLVAEGALAPLARLDELDVYCPACPEDTGGDGPRLYFSSRGGGKPVRLGYNLPAADFACATGGGSLRLRYFWQDKEADEYTPLVPFAEVSNLERRFAVKNQRAVLEEGLSRDEVCRQQKLFVWEVVGLDSFSDLSNIGGISSGRLLRRGGLEGYRCPD